MSYKIIKKLGPFSAAHHLTTVPPGHQCGRIHGHNYEIEVELECEEVNEHGFVVDYGELKVFEEYAQARMDHRDLNEQFSFSPTAENLARHFFDWIEGTTAWPVVAVRVSETPGKTMSEYSKPVSVRWVDSPPTPPAVVNYHIELKVDNPFDALLLSRILRSQNSPR